MSNQEFKISADNQILYENKNTIFVLPCLQELKKGGNIIGAEYEQQPSKWDSVNNTVVPLFSGLRMGYGSADGSDEFDKYWSGKSTMPNVDITKKGLLTIPNCSSFGFKSNNSEKTPECKYFSCTDKWNIYTNFLKSRCPNYNSKNVALLVTHHNRMRDSTQGLIPFKDDSPYNAYANNFCLKISIKDNDISYSLFYKGFPDKGDFEDCTGYTNANRIGDGDGDYNDVTIGGGDDYKYFCNTDVEKFIKTELIDEGIRKEGINGINLDIYVIRHGNALHNKPVSVNDFYHATENIAFAPKWEQFRLDSSLTPLGMYQAKELGGYFKDKGVLNDANVILCSSFLQRTQLTGLLLLFYAGIGLNPTMKNGIIDMLNQAIIRYSKAQENGFKPTKFLGYSPLGEIIKDNNGDKKYEAFKGANTKFVDYLSSLSILLATNDNSKKAIEILTDNLVKNSVIERTDGWKEMGIQQPNEGGKKRRQTKKQRVMKSKKVRRAKKHNKKSKKVKRRSNKRKA